VTLRASSSIVEGCGIWGGTQSSGEDEVARTPVGGNDDDCDESGVGWDGCGMIKCVLLEGFARSISTSSSNACEAAEPGKDVTPEP
jgi:hypothetical protein